MFRKRFAQHFLRDPFVIQKIITILNPKPEEHLIEIGPGDGALTYPILSNIHQLEAIELDRDLIPKLEAESIAFGTLTIHAQDVLTVNFARLQQDNRKLRLFGNLPYNISTPLIFHIAQYTSHISDMLFMLQKEVADRLVAPPSTKAYGCLSVMTQYRYNMRQLFHVSPEAFEPPPKVNSSIVQFIPDDDTAKMVLDYKQFQTVVKTAFNQRRKTLHNSLKQLIPPFCFEKAGINPDLRAENLSPQEFIKLANIIC